MIAINGKVYKIGPYLGAATNAGRLLPERSLFPEEFTEALLRNVGRDATAEISGIRQAPEYMKCMDKLFYSGKYATTFYDGCALIDPVTYSLAALILLVLLLKTFTWFFSGLAHLGFCKISLSTANVVGLISCYNESEYLLKKCIESFAASEYEQNQKLLFIVCDGIMPNSKTMKPTYETILNILDQTQTHSRSCSYKSVGEGIHAYNTAQVFSGQYFYEMESIPYILVVKSGSKNELRRLGNRGKRDSHLLFWGFLNRLSSKESLLSPLDFELLNHFRHYIRVDPRKLEYALTLDADTHLEKHTLAQLVEHLDTNGNSAVVTCQTEIHNHLHNFTTMLQAYSFFLSHEANVSFEGSFGTLSTTWGNCNLVRLRRSDGSLCALDTAVLEDYSKIPDPTMHSRNFIYFGEDRSSYLWIKNRIENAKVGYSARAVAHTDVPEKFLSMVGQFRQRWNASFHLKWQVLLGKFSLWTKLWTFFDFTSMILLPSVTVYFYSLLIRFAFGTYFVSYLLAPAAFVAFLVINLLLLMLRLRGSYVILLLVFLLFGVPLFFIVLPVIAFWQSDNMLWSDSKKVLGSGTLRSHGCLPPQLDADGEMCSTVPRVPQLTLLSWEKGDFETLSQPIYQSYPLISPVPKSSPANLHHKILGKADSPKYGGARIPNKSTTSPSPKVFTPRSLNHKISQSSDSSAGQLTAPIKTSPKVSSSVKQSPRERFDSIDTLDDGMSFTITSNFSKYEGTPSGTSTPSLQPTPTPPARSMESLSKIRKQQAKPMKEVTVAGSGRKMIQTPVSRPSTPKVQPSAVPAPIETKSRNTKEKMYLQPTKFEKTESRTKNSDKTDSRRRRSRRGQSGKIEVHSPAKLATSYGSEDLPLRALSVAPSDYLSDAGSSPMDNRSLLTPRNAHRNMSNMFDNNDKHVEDEDLIELAGGLTKEEIKEEVRVFLTDIDLNKVTRRQVKDHMYQQFGDSIDFYHDYVNLCIEEFTLEKLALI